MISSERSQNTIVSFVIILTVVSSVFLFNNVQYYHGSFTLATRMEVNLVSTVVRDIDPTNDSIYPILSFTLNFRTDSPSEGNVRLNYIEATIWLNDDYLSFTGLSRYLSTDADQLLHPDFDRNFTLSKTVDSEADRTAFLDANSTDSWNWYVRFRYNFITFENPRSLTWRVLYLNWTGSTTIL
ncbi:MAG: hypothetical protein ACW98U_02620 [Candidatus Thorarchaeota archaeon]|jgi:hypothetical protein